MFIVGGGVIKDRKEIKFYFFFSFSDTTRVSKSRSREKSVIIGHGRPRPLVLGDISQLIVATERPRFESRSGLPFWNGSSSLGLGFLNPTSQLKRTNVKGFCTQLVIKWAS